MLANLEFPLAESNELVEASLVTMGLGMPRNQLSFVKQSPQYWDTTTWDAIPRPFLDPPCQAYVNALTAWLRNESNARWIDQLHPEIIRPTKKALKFLNKTQDTFLKSIDSPIHDRTPSEWLELANQKSVSNQIAALQFFAGTQSFPDDHQDLLLSKLRSRNDAVVVHAIGAAESIESPSAEIIDELRMLTDSIDEIAKSKAMVTLSKLRQLDQNCFNNALKMIQSDTKHVVYTGLLGMLTKESIDEAEQNIVNRVFLKYLQSCNYEFVNLFVTAYSRWVPDLNSYLHELLDDDYREYLDIALEAAKSIEKLESVE